VPPPGTGSAGCVCRRQTRYSASRCDGQRLGRFGGKKTIQRGLDCGPVFLKKIGKIHRRNTKKVRPGSGFKLVLVSGSNGSATILRLLSSAGFLRGLGFFQLLLALARKLHAFFKKFHGVIQRELRTFQPPNDFFEARQRALEIGFLVALVFSVPVNSRSPVSFKFNSFLIIANLCCSAQISHHAF